jgi:chromosome segregation ATPase
MSSTSIWTRLGNWLRLSQSPDQAPSAEAPEASQVHTTDSLTVANEPTTATEPTAPNRWQRREQMIQKLQDGYEQVIDLLSSVRQHLETHAEHSRRIDQAVTRLAESMSELPSLTSRQTELLTGIREQMEGQRAQQEKLAGVVEQWPETARRQSELLDGLQQEIRTGREAQAEVAGSLQTVGESLGSLTESTRRREELLDTLGRTLDETHEQVVGALEAQGKRVTQLVWAALSLSGLALVLALIAILRHYGAAS